MNAMKEAISLVGGVKKLARGLGVSHQAVRKFESSRVPAERVIDVAILTGWRVTPHQIRPDLYPLPSDALVLDAKRAETSVQEHAS